MGPDHWGPRSEEWVFHMNYPPELEPLFDTDEKVLAHMRERVGLPDFDPKVHVVTRWSLEGLLAPTRGSAGSSSLATPRTGTRRPEDWAEQRRPRRDCNLCWKTRRRAAGQPAPALLDTYQPERVRFVARNTQRSVENALNHVALSRGSWASYRRVDPPSRCRANALELWEDGAAGEARRETVCATHGQPVDGVQGAQRRVRLPGAIRGRRRRRYARTGNPDDVRIYRPAPDPARRFRTPGAA